MGPGCASALRTCPNKPAASTQTNMPASHTLTPARSARGRRIEARFKVTFLRMDRSKTGTLPKLPGSYDTPDRRGREGRVPGPVPKAGRLRRALGDRPRWRSRVRGEDGRR